MQVLPGTQDQQPGGRGGLTLSVSYSFRLRGKLSRIINDREAIGSAAL